MRRYAIFAILLQLIVFSIFSEAQETPSLPIFYNFNHNRLDFHVMDALTGDVLYQFETEEIPDCAISLSDSHKWLIYSQENEHNFLLNLETGTSTSIPRGNLTDFIEEESHHLLAFHYMYDEYTLIVYETRSNRVLFTATTFASSQELAMRFSGTDLLYAFIHFDEEHIEFHRQNAYHDEVKTFPISQPSDWQNLSLSPDDNFLLGVGADNAINLLNLLDGTISQLGESQNLHSLQWLPTANATLTYITEDELGHLAFATYPVNEQTGASIEAQYSFLLSPNSQYATYWISDDEEDSLWLMDTQNSESRAMDKFTGIDSLRWLSDSQFAAAFPNPDTHERDIYFYDANTGESRQLTDTPELDERFDCAAG